MYDTDRLTEKNVSIKFLIYLRNPWESTIMSVCMFYAYCSTGVKGRYYEKGKFQIKEF